MQEQLVIFIVAGVVSLIVFVAMLAAILRTATNTGEAVIELRKIVLLLKQQAEIDAVRASTTAGSRPVPPRGT